MHLQSHIMESLASVIYLEYIKMNVPTMTSPIILWAWRFGYCHLGFLKADDQEWDSNELPVKITRQPHPKA